MFKRTPHTSVYRQLLAAGYSHDDIVNATSDRSSPMRSALLSTFDPGNGEDLIVGVRYTGDFRAEEEYGMSSLAESFVKDQKQSIIVEETDLGTLFMFINRGSHYGVRDYNKAETIERQRVAAMEHALFSFRHDAVKPREGQYVPADNRYNFPKPLDWYSVAELRAAAKQDGLTKLPARKDDLINAIITHRLQFRDTKVVPANFHSGSVLGIVAPKGIVADTLQIIVEAAASDSIGFGGDNNPFGRGATFFDLRDRGPILLAKMKAEKEWHDKHMKAAKKVEDSLKDAGMLFFLGNPSEKDGKITYYINFSPRGSKQIFGWFDLTELAQIAAGDLSPVKER